MNLGGAELLILVGLAVLLFGAGWLPKAARNLGKAKLEFDEVQRQFNEAKDSVVDATGVKELESTVRKANRIINSSPQKMMKDAAKSTVMGSTRSHDADDESAAEDGAGHAGDDDIEDADIIDAAAPADKGATDTTINVDKSDKSE